MPQTPTTGGVVASPVEMPCRRAAPGRPELPVPDPQFPTRTPALRRSVPLPTAPVTLPVRSPGTHLHPQLRRSPVAGRGGDSE